MSLPSPEDLSIVGALVAGGLGFISAFFAFKFSAKASLAIAVSLFLGAFTAQNYVITVWHNMIG